MNVLSLVRGGRVSRDAVEVFALVEEDEPLTLDPEEKRAIRKRLERANELEGEPRASGEAPSGPGGTPTDQDLRPVPRRQ